ncbi:actin-binding Rho-activating protein [Biomphalaria glabrata]
MTSQNVSSQKNCLNNKISMWQKKADEHKEKQLLNPFSEWAGASHRKALDKNDPNYGRPVEGSLTEYRGKQAGHHISAEIVELCHVIREIGTPGLNGSYMIKFGQLFEAYTRISNKLVGMLLRARKQGLVTFEGEMLYQRRDDDVLITCIHVPDL